MQTLRTIAREGCRRRSAVVGNVACDWSVGGAYCVIGHDQVAIFSKASCIFLAPPFPMQFVTVSCIVQPLCNSHTGDWLVKV